jgi:FAD-dependent urate hydroxylase
MFLRSGPDWHLDTAGVHTLEAYLEQRAIAPAEVDPLPIKVFLDYAEWFRQAKGIQPVEDLVVDLTKPDDRFEAVLDSGERILADTVVAAPGIAHFTNRPTGPPTPATWCGSRTCRGLGS